MSDDWRSKIYEVRTALGLTQLQLAEMTGLSLSTVRGYERGNRHPRRERLTALLDALHIDTGSRNRILVSAGFAPDGLSRRPANLDDWMYSPQEAEAEVNRYRWPAFVLTERAEILVANQSAQLLWGVDLRHEFTSQVERNMLSVASHPRFADQCLNWEEAVGVIVANFKTYHLGPESLDNPSPYFAAVLQHFLQGDPKYVGKFLDLWQRAPAQWDSKLRWSYPVTWSKTGTDKMRFHCFASAANELDGLAFHDWIPLDGETWSILDAILQNANQRGSD